MPNELAYGFVSLEQLLGRRVDDVGFTVVTDAINASVAEYNRVTNALFTTIGMRRTTQAQYRFYLPGAESDMQPLDQWGTPIPVQRGRSYYDVGLPIRGAGTAWGTNRVTRVLQTVQEANDHVVHALRADTRWMRRHFLAAFMHNNSYVFDDPEFGNLTVVPLANGDSTLYVKNAGALATDDHYLAQAATIADAANPFPTIYDELREHPENASSTIVVYVASNLVASIEALANFVEGPGDPDITIAPGNVVDTLNTTGSAYLAFGDEVLGKVDRCWIVEWSGLPSNYMLAYAFGTPDIVAMREYEAAALRGLIPENYSPDGARLENRLIRYAGFGVNNRVGAVMYQIGNATYQVPAGYEAVIPN